MNRDKSTKLKFVTHFWNITIWQRCERLTSSLMKRTLLIVNHFYRVVQAETRTLFWNRTTYPCFVMTRVPPGPSGRQLCRGGCNGLNMPTKGVVIGRGDYPHFTNFLKNAGLRFHLPTDAFSGGSVTPLPQNPPRDGHGYHRQLLETSLNVVGHIVFPWTAQELPSMLCVTYYMQLCSIFIVYFTEWACEVPSPYSLYPWHTHEEYLYSLLQALKHLSWSYININIYITVKTHE